jgi:hypothetical protein
MAALAEATVEMMRAAYRSWNASGSSSSTSSGRRRRGSTRLDKGPRSLMCFS